MASLRGALKHKRANTCDALVTDHMWPVNFPYSILIWCRVHGFAFHAVRLVRWAVARGYSHIEDLLVAVPDDLAHAIGLPKEVRFLLQPAVLDLGRLRLSDKARKRSTRWAVFAPLERGPSVSGTSISPFSEQFGQGHCYECQLRTWSARLDWVPLRLRSSRLPSGRCFARL